MSGEMFNQSPDQHPEEERPPLFSTWWRLYVAVLGSLVFYIILMLIFMKVFA